MHAQVIGRSQRTEADSSSAKVKIIDYPAIKAINIIKHFRNKYRLSQKQLADMLQVNQASISLWERGAKPSGPAGILLGILIELEYHPYALRQLFETVGLPRIPHA